MDPLEVIAAKHGVFLTQEAYALGYDDYAIARAVRGRFWHRVRRGAFVPYPVWSAAGEIERHRLLAAAVHRSYGDRVAFSHVTATLLHGIALWGVDLSRVHVTRLDGGAGRTESDVVHHEAWALEPDDIGRLDGSLVTAPTRATLETGLLGTTEQSLVSIDSLLHLKLGTAIDVGNTYDVIQHWPGSQHLQVAVRMGDGRSESVGESRCRWLFFNQGLPAPELQRRVYDTHGRLIGITDFDWARRRTFGEFDGKVKFGRLLKEGQSASDVLFEEKKREDAIRRATHCGMVRLVWLDVERPVTTARWLRAYLDEAV